MSVNSLITIVKDRFHTHYLGFVISCPKLDHRGCVHQVLRDSSRYTKEVKENDK